MILRVLFGVSAFTCASAGAQTVGPGTTGGGLVSTITSSQQVGQTFIARNAVLDNASFRFATVSSGGGSFTFSVNAMSGTTIGAPLYSQTFVPTVTTMTFSNLAVATQSGSTYAFVFSPFGAQPGSTQAAIGYYSNFTGNAYLDGTAFVLTNNSGNPVGQSPSFRGDLAFSAAFRVAAAPEPSTWALLILGFGVVGGALRRRKRAPSTHQTSMLPA